MTEYTAWQKSSYSPNWRAPNRSWTLSCSLTSPLTGAELSHNTDGWKQAAKTTHTAQSSPPCSIARDSLGKAQAGLCHLPQDTSSPLLVTVFLQVLLRESSSLWARMLPKLHTWETITDRVLCACTKQSSHLNCVPSTWKGWAQPGWSLCVGRSIY